MGTSAFQDVKLAIIETLNVSKDALHIHVGLAIMLGVALVLRKPLSSPLPWLAAVAAALAGEAWDMWDDLTGIGRVRWFASLRDLVSTLLWPTVLLVLARLRLAGMR